VGVGYGGLLLPEVSFFYDFVNLVAIDPEVDKVDEDAEVGEEERDHLVGGVNLLLTFSPFSSSHLSQASATSLAAPMR
jgi:hypothetical protein